MSTDQQIAIERVVIDAFAANAAHTIAKHILQSPGEFFDVSFRVRLTRDGQIVNFHYVRIETE